MKSLLISSDYFPPQTGGISHYMAAIASALGPERVCCLTGVRADDARTALSQLKSNVYRWPTAFAKSTVLQSICLTAVMSQIMFRERPRAVQLATVADGYIGLLLRRWLGLPFIVYAHGNEILDALNASWDKPRLTLKRSVRVLANSRFTAQLVERAGVNPSRISVVHPGCDIDRFRPLPPDPEFKRRLLGDRSGDRVIVTVGNLVPRKGYDMVIKALPHLIRECPNLTYLIVTSNPGNYERELDALARAAGVRDRVVFAHDVPTSDLPRVYALSDVFVMPSRANEAACDVEGFGLVYLEANACGKPVVGGWSGGVPDAIVDGKTGLVVDPNDPMDVAAALQRLLNDQEFANQLGRQGCSWVTGNFGWAQVASRVQSILDSIANDK